MTQKPNSNQPYTLIKILLLGKDGCGKSCFLYRFAEDTFDSAFITTIGIDFKVKTMLCEGSHVKLQIWDTPGHTRYRTIIGSYL